MSDQDWENYLQYFNEDATDLYGNPIDEETLNELQQD